MNKKLIEAVSNLKEDEALRLAREMMLEDSEGSVEIMQSCREAARIVSDRYDDDEYFLPELVMSTEILRRIAELLESELAAARAGLERDNTEQAIQWLKTASQLKQLSWQGGRGRPPSRLPEVIVRAFEAHNKK